MKELSPQMNITVQYHTYEQTDCVRLVWDGCSCGRRDNTNTLNMEMQEEDVWKACFQPSFSNGRNLDFHFEVWRGDDMIDYEPFLCHHYNMSGCRERVCIRSCFIPRTTNNNYRYSSAFRQCIHEFQNAEENRSSGSVSLVVQDFLCPDGCRLLMTGDAPELGEWNVDKALPVSRIGSYTYAVSLGGNQADGRWEYKFVLRKKNSSEVIWEEGENRVFQKGNGSTPDSPCLMELSPLRLPCEDDRGAGMVVPVFSLRSRESWGVGDFGDLQKMIDWASSVGMHVLQVLPVNDTTRTGSWEDSYPYKGISIFALHPMFVDLNALGGLRDREAQEAAETERKRLERMPQMDYEAVNRLKLRYVRAYFQEHEGEIACEYKKNPVKVSDDIGQMTLGMFWKKFRFWLFPYCCYRVLMDEYGTADFRLWQNHSQYDETALTETFKDKRLAREFLFHVWLQYVLATQLASARSEARKKGVVLKGDMPIGVSRDSATAWFFPQYFHFDGQTGAPPDFFSALGQNWGFPTYDWDKILADNGDWWRLRLQNMANYFDAFRIDHVLGFFRIWQIPYGTSDGRLGHFLPDLPMTEDEIRRNGFWKPMDECVSSEGGEPWNVLFVRDKKVPSLYHPAVSGHSTFQYQQLSESDKRAFDHIHDNYFNHRHNDFWAKEGMRRLPCVVNSSSMLVCAEDLGMIPDCVPGILAHFCILSLEVQSMPKRPEGQFSWLPNNPFCSVDTVTTHDMEPLRLWWKNNPGAAQCYFEQRMGGRGAAPKELSTDMAEDILRQHLQSPSLLCVIALQDWLAVDEDLRNPDIEEELVNNPANPRHYWRYRMHLPVERLMEDEDFNNHIRTLVAERKKCL